MHMFLLHSVECTIPSFFWNSLCVPSTVVTSVEPRAGIRTAAPRRPASRVEEKQEGRSAAQGLSAASCLRTAQHVHLWAPGHLLPPPGFHSSYFSSVWMGTLSGAPRFLIGSHPEMEVSGPRPS